MASEATLRISLQIKSGNLVYQSQPTAFLEDIIIAKGPSPGALTVDTTGTNVDFGELTTPALCFLANFDDTNYVEYGIHDGSLFHPLGEIPAGKGYIIRLSRNLGEEEDVPGTGTTAPINSFYLRANTAECIVLVAAFDA